MLDFLGCKEQIWGSCPQTPRGTCLRHGLCNAVFNLLRQWRIHGAMGRSPLLPSQCYFISYVTKKCKFVTKYAPNFTFSACKLKNIFLGGATPHPSGANTPLLRRRLSPRAFGAQPIHPSHLIHLDRLVYDAEPLLVRYT